VRAPRGARHPRRPASLSSARPATGARAAPGRWMAGDGHYRGLLVPTECAVHVYQTLLAAQEGVPGAGLVHAGYHALNSLRLEKGYRSWGHDIGPDDTPLEAGLGFAVAWHKDGFTGREALVRQSSEGIRRRLVQLHIPGPGPMVFHDEPVYRDGALAGTVTSAALAPTLGGTVALAYLCGTGDDAGAVVTDDWVGSGEYQVDVAGGGCPPRCRCAPCTTLPPRARARRTEPARRCRSPRDGDRPGAWRPPRRARLLGGVALGGRARRCQLGAHVAGGGSGLLGRRAECAGGGGPCGSRCGGPGRDCGRAGPRRRGRRAAAPRAGCRCSAGSRRGRRGAGSGGAGPRAGTLATGQGGRNKWRRQQCGCHPAGLRVCGHAWSVGTQLLGRGRRHVRAW
jgi:hypothetical protein